MDRGRPANPLEYAPTGKLYLGSAIRQMRLDKKLSLRKLAELISYHPGALSKVENNRALISIEALQKIAEILEVNADELKQMPVHPRLSKQTAGLGKPTTVEQKGVFEELKEDVQQVKAEFAEVKAILNDLVCSLRKIIPSLVIEPAPWGKRGQSSPYQTHGDDPSDQETNKSVAAGSGRELAQIKNAKYNDVEALFSTMIREIDQLKELEQPHTGRVMFTYVVEESAYPYIPELEQRWFEVLENAIDNGWDIIHFIWLNGDKNRTSHLVRHMRTFMGRGGNYQAYVTETMPLRGGYDFVAIEAPRAEDSVGFELYAGVVGNTYVQSGRVFYHSEPEQLENILDRLRRWEDGEDGFQRLLGDEQSVLQEKLLLLLDVDPLGQ